MLKQRIITALILIPLVVWGVLYLPSSYFSAIIGLFVILGAREWAKFVFQSALAAESVFVLVFALALFATAALPQMQTVSVLLPLAVVWWFWATVMVFRYRGDHGLNGKLRYAAAGFVVLIPAWYALHMLHASSDKGPAMVLFLMVMIWIADSGAYFSGRAFGKNKLAVHVSPGKTWQGVYGALVASGLFAVAGGYYFDWQGTELLLFIALCVVTVMVSIVGDLFESLIKRRVGVKDSGQLLPGHGGVLDRIDSLTAAAPWFVAGLWSTGLLI